MKHFFKESKISLIMKLRGKGIKNKKILNSIELIPREKFIESSLQKHAWEDVALPIGMGQTISQPYIVALMTEELSLKGREIVLEVGTGSGYQSAILSNLCRRVYSIEKIKELYILSNELFKELKISNITTKLGDGSIGWEEIAPFDGIIVTCASKQFPQKLLNQLKIGGKLIIPEENEIGNQVLNSYKVVEKENIEKKYICDVKFVPMV